MNFKEIIKSKLTFILQSFIYVSTLYAHSNNKLTLIKECFYTYPVDHKDLITIMRASPINDEKLSKYVFLLFSIYDK